MAVQLYCWLCRWASGGRRLLGTDSVHVCCCHSSSSCYWTTGLLGSGVIVSDSVPGTWYEYSTNLWARNTSLQKPTIKVLVRRFVFFSSSHSNHSLCTLCCQPLSTIEAPAKVVLDDVSQGPRASTQSSRIWFAPSEIVILARSIQLHASTWNLEPHKLDCSKT
jgi:hypothetical protein